MVEVEEVTGPGPSRSSNSPEQRQDPETLKRVLLDDPPSCVQYTVTNPSDETSPCDDTTSLSYQVQPEATTSSNVTTPCDGTSSDGMWFSNIQSLRGRENYSVWKFQMKNLLIHEDLWYAIVGYPDGDTTDEATKERNNLKALSKINLMLDVACISHTMSACSAKEAWTALENVYEDKGRILLLRKLFSLKQENFASVEDYINGVTLIAQQIAEIGNPVDEEILGVVLLKGIPNIEDFKSLIMSLEDSGSTLTSDIAKHWLMMNFGDLGDDSDEPEEVVERKRTVIRWFQETSTQIVEGALRRNKAIKNTPNSKKGGRKNCWKCGQRGHIQAQCPNKGGQSSQSDRSGIGKQIISAVAETVIVRGAYAVGGAVGGGVATAVNIGAKVFKKK